MTADVLLYVGEALGKYGFPNGHPFGPDRQDAFWKETLKQGLDKSAKLAAPRAASRDEIERFHSARYVERVDGLSELGVRLDRLRRHARLSGRLRCVRGGSRFGARRPRARDERRRLPHVSADRRPAPRAARQWRRLLRVQRLRRGDRYAARKIRSPESRVRRHRRPSWRRAFLSIRARPRSIRRRHSRRRHVSVSRYWRRRRDRQRQGCGHQAQHSDAARFHR